jgi:hypothetical protein
MRLGWAILLVVAPLTLNPQTAPLSASPCENTPAYSTCDLVLELAGPDAAAHPDPYTSVDLKAELRSPNMRTYGIPAYWDGGRRMVLRFAPTEAGRWEYRLTSNIAAWNGQTGAFTAAASDSPGFVAPANVHHWAYTARNLPHLWMAATEPGFAFWSDEEFQRVADTRRVQKFNHLRGLVLGDGPDAVLSSAGLPDVRQFARLDARVRYWNQKGGIVDLVLASSAGALARALPSAAARRRFLLFLAGRYAAMNVTWELAGGFENDNGSRAILDDAGNTLKQLDSFHHPLTTGAEITSGPLLDGGWMNFLSYGTADPSIGAIEHQLYQQPAVTRLGRENSGAGKSSPSDVDADEFRHRLWNAAMNGQYPVYQNSGAGPAHATSPGARSMTVWFDFMLATRHWDLEPYFELDGGRALALPDVEYIVYVDKPGPVELTVARHSYDVVWMDPADGSTQRRKYSGEHFVGEPPDRFHDWVLRLVREGTLESMNRSYKFESRDVPVQEIQVNPEKVPFEIDAPSGDLTLGKPAYFSVKLKRASRGTRDMLWLWTCEVTEGRQGYRVLGTTRQGTFYPPAGLANEYPANLLLRVYGINGYGTVYMSPKGFGLNR